VQTSFGRIIPKLARHHRVIAPEQQDHGHSGDRPEPVSFEQMADDTAALLGQLGVQTADVLGFSNGGVVALQLSLRHPELVRRLMVCSSFYARDAMPAAFWQGFDKATMADMPPPLREAFIASAPNKAEIPARFAKLVALMKDFRDIPTAALRSLVSPALVMVGDRDVMSVEHEAALVRLLPHAELAVFPGSGHGTYLGTVEGGPTSNPLVPLALTMIENFLKEERTAPSER
jgi:pimeloyl-ACP methyl ester carboxylesterase